MRPGAQRRRHRGDGIRVVGRRDGEAGIVCRQSNPQESIGGADPCQWQRLDQPVLQGLKQSRNPPFGLRRQGLNPGDPQGIQSTLDLRRRFVLGIMIGEDAVPVTRVPPGVHAG